MIDTEDISLDNLSPTNDKAGLLLERLALDSEKDEKTVDINYQYKLQQIISIMDREGSSSEGSGNEDSSSEDSSAEDSSDNESSNEEAETDIIFDVELSPKREAEKDLEIEKQSTRSKKIETSDQEIANNEKTNTEIYEINEYEGQNNGQKNENDPKSAEVLKQINFVDDEEETIHTILSNVQSRQDLLKEKMVALKASTEFLRDQLEKEKEKLKEESKKTVELEKMIKNENQIKEQYIKQSWKVADEDMDYFGDYKYIKNCTINFGMEIKKRNYQNWLSEIASECEKQLTTVQNNLLILKPLKETVSKWRLNNGESALNFKSEETGLFGKGELMTNIEVEGKTANKKEEKDDENVDNERNMPDQTLQDEKLDRSKKKDEEEINNVENKDENHVSEIQKTKFDKNNHEIIGGNDKTRK